jgi:hypothetical protein
MNIGQTLEHLQRLKEARTELNKRAEEFSAQIETTEALLLKVLNEQGVRSVQVEGFTATISSTDYGSIEDYEAFTKYVTDNNATYLFQRRLMQKSIAELRQIEGEIPGITFFKKNSISLRKN